MGTTLTMTAKDLSELDRLRSSYPSQTDQLRRALTLLNLADRGNGVFEAIGIEPQASEMRLSELRLREYESEIAQPRRAADIVDTLSASLRGTREVKLLKELRQLVDKPTIIVPNLTPEALDSFDVQASALSHGQKKALRAVENQPLGLLSRILRSPDEMRLLDPYQFEHFVAEILEELGYTDVIRTPNSGDGGKDVVARKIINGMSLTFYFECKLYAQKNKVQLQTLRTLLGTVSEDPRRVNKGVLVTTSTFTRGSRQLLMREARLDGKDFNGILGWLDEIRSRASNS